MKYLGIVITLLSVTYGQLIIKYEIDRIGSLPSMALPDIFSYLLKVFTNMGILSGFLAAFIAAVSWVFTIGKFELSSAYPLLSLNFVLVPLLSIYLFEETINLPKIVGIVVIVSGIFIFSKGI